jgi:16S rRNA (cytidine1402-2'-O)-methyltransferase
LESPSPADGELQEDSPEDSPMESVLVGTGPADLEEPRRGGLSLLATPIGNLQDLSPRAAKCLRGADLVLAEDTRVTRKLLSWLDAHPRRLVSCHDHNERGRSGLVVEALQNGERVLLVSDAGTPLISDPGYTLVRTVLEAGLPVWSIPGPNAAATALVGSGLPPDKWLFGGFLARTSAERKAMLVDLGSLPVTLVFYVSPHRLGDTLGDVAKVFGTERMACLAGDLTKRGERWLRGSLGELCGKVAEEEGRGEWTLVVAPSPPVARETPSEQAIGRLVEACRSAGITPRVARGLLEATFGLAKRDAYQRVLASLGETPDEG